MKVVSILAMALGIVLAGSAIGQGYPAKPVRIVVPYPTGGGNDLLARMIAPKLTEKWGQTVVVDNRGGASGMIGAEIVAKAPPDGHTVMLCASPERAPHATAP